jgi:hypothetical protein
MISNDQPGLLEKIRNAVQPLTESGEFSLGSISTNDWESCLNVKIISSWIIIRTGVSAVHTGVGCAIIIPSRKKIFNGDLLFPALKLNIPIYKGEFQEYPLPVPGSSNETTKYQAKWDAILRGTGFIEKIHQQCLGIRENLPEIRQALDPDHLDQTVQKYFIEFKKTNTLATIESCCNLTNS